MGIITMPEAIKTINKRLMRIISLPGKHFYIFMTGYDT